MTRRTDTWKSTERKVCRAWGGDRHGPSNGLPCSDCDDTPVSLEVTRRKGRVILGSKVAQAKLNAMIEGKPFVLVVADYGDRLDQMDCVVKHGWLLDVCRKAGLIP